MKKLLVVVVFFIILGCGYSLHTKANLPFQEIYIRNVENLTLEPGLQDKTRQIMYHTLLLNGFKVVEKADKILDIQIKNFRYTTLSEISLETVEYQILMEVGATLYSRDGKKIKEFTPSSPFLTYFRTTKDLQSVIANKNLAVESLLRDICDDFIRKLIFEYASDSGV